MLSLWLLKTRFVCSRALAFPSFLLFFFSLFRFNFPNLIKREERSYWEGRCCHYQGTLLECYRKVPNIRFSVLRVSSTKYKSQFVVVRVCVWLSRPPCLTCFFCVSVQKKTEPHVDIQPETIGFRCPLFEERNVQGSHNIWFKQNYLWEGSH